MALSNSSEQQWPMRHMFNNQRHAFADSEIGQTFTPRGFRIKHDNIQLQFRSPLTDGPQFGLWCADRQRSATGPIHRDTPKTVQPLLPAGLGQSLRASAMRRKSVLLGPYPPPHGGVAI